MTLMAGLFKLANIIPKFHLTLLRNASLSVDMTKNLKVKAVAFDLPVVINYNIEGESSAINNMHGSGVKLEEKGSGAQLSYADKIKLKMAKNAEKSVMPVSKASLLNASTRWLLAEGMGDVLDYAFHRTVRLALLGGYKVPQNTVQQLISQLNNTRFSFTRPAVSDSLSIADNYITSLTDMEQSLNLKKSQILLVSGDETLLALGRDRGYYTCRYRGSKDRLYGQLTTDFSAGQPIQIKDAIDDLIGIALRSSVSHF